MIGRHQGRAVAQAGLDDSLDLAFRVGIKPEDRAEVEPGRVVEGQPIGLGAGEGLLVRVDLALAERFEPDPGEETPPGMRLALDLERLLIDVERDVIVLAEQALSQPVLEESGGTRVTTLGRGIAGLCAVELQADRIVRAGLIEPVLQGRVDDVVGGSHHVRQRPDSCNIIADTAERTHVGHGERSHSRWKS